METTDTREKVRHLTELVTTGRANEAYRTYYAPDVVMQENGETPRTSLQASIDRQDQATTGVTVNEFAPRSIVVDGSHAAIEWVIDITTPDGSHIHIEEFALQTWKDGKIVQERFYYDPSQSVPKPKNQ
ncbi:MAG: nuclear transport factor 2 family protein [Cytophagales bacterium]|nr:nuclear transport factor 2 family protein [Armatimonadota bacterium]